MSRTDVQTSPVPRYRFVASHLRRDISAGRYAPGDQLPTEGALARDFGVSRGTIIKAIAQLVAEGIVHKRQGAGSFVSLPSLHRRSSRLLSFSETVDAEGRRATQRVLGYSQASEALCRACGAIEPSIRLERLRLVDGVACAIHTSVIPQRVIDRLDSGDLGEMLKGDESDFSLYAAFRDAGISLDHGSEHVSARLASAEEATALKIARPAAVMTVARRSFDADSRLIEAAEAVFHAQYYSYELDLVRKTGATGPQRLRLASGTGAPDIKPGGE